VSAPEITVLLFTAARDVADIYRRHMPATWRVEHLESRDDEDEKRARLARADVLIHTDVLLTRALLAEARRLRLIHRQGVGLDSLDLDAVADRGVPVCICPVGTPEAVAEHAILLMLAAGRHLTRLHDEVARQGRWPRWTYRNRSFGLQGSVVGLVGFGRTGQAVARRLLGFACRLLVYRRPGRPVDEHWRSHELEVSDDLDAVFSSSHVVTLHCPLTPETRGHVDPPRQAPNGPAPAHGDPR
jgi:phosphoglycerate dehydrogenase-like enzyme